MIGSSNIQMQKAGAGIACQPTKCLPASDLERSKDVVHLMGASKVALRCRSQGATVGSWFKSARQSGSSAGLRIFVI